jgi:hypothetical protein
MKVEDTKALWCLESGMPDGGWSMSNFQGWHITDVGETRC